MTRRPCSSQKVCQPWGSATPSGRGRACSQTSVKSPRQNRYLALTLFIWDYGSVTTGIVSLAIRPLLSHRPSVVPFLDCACGHGAPQLKAAAFCPLSTARPSLRQGAPNRPTLWIAAHHRHRGAISRQERRNGSWIILLRRGFARLHHHAAEIVEAGPGGSLLANGPDPKPPRTVPV
jgi:hypothetical protein